eukprot:322277-Chlamydomonas_euryale.AAC.3
MHAPNALSRTPQQPLTAGAAPKVPLEWRPTRLCSACHHYERRCAVPCRADTGRAPPALSSTTHGLKWPRAGGGSPGLLCQRLAIPSSDLVRNSKPADRDEPTLNVRRSLLRTNKLANRPTLARRPLRPSLLLSPCPARRRELACPRGLLASRAGALAAIAAATDVAEARRQQRQQLQPRRGSGSGDSGDVPGARVVTSPSRAPVDPFDGRGRAPAAVPSNRHQTPPAAARLSCPRHTGTRATVFPHRA